MTRGHSTFGVWGSPARFLNRYLENRDKSGAFGIRSLFNPLKNTANNKSLKPAHMILVPKLGGPGDTYLTTFEIFGTPHVCLEILCLLRLKIFVVTRVERA